MAEWDRDRFEEGLRELLRQMEETDSEEAVRSFAASLHEDYPPAAVKARANSIRKRHRIRGHDARAAFRIYEAYILSKNPLLIRIIWPVVKRIIANWVLESSPEQVVIRTPSATGRILCPVMRAADGDLAKARPLCEALFRHHAFGEPMSIMAAKEANPGIRWEIHEYRERSDLPCYYAITFDPDHE